MGDKSNSGNNGPRRTGGILTGFRRIIEENRDEQPAYKERTRIFSASGKKSPLKGDTKYREREYYQLLTENVQEAIIILNSSGTVIYESPSCEAVLGCDSDEATRGNLFDRVHPEDMPKATDAFTRLLRKKEDTVKLELRIRRKDRSWRYLEALASNHLDNPIIEGIVVNLRDITDYRECEQNLKIASERYGTLFENSTVAITVADENENIISWNKYAEALLDMDGHELYMKPVSDLYPEEEWASIRAQDIRQKGMQHHLETRMIKKNGELIEVDLSLSVLRGSDGELTGSIAVITDITNHKQVREELQLLENNYGTLFENSAIAITLTDRNEKIISWNKYTEVLLGMDKDDLYMKPVKSLYPEEEWKAIRAQNIRQKGMQHHLETRIIRKNKEIIDVDLSLNILKGPDGEIAGSIGIIADISKCKKAQEQLQQVEETYRTIFENSAVAITQTNADEKIVSWNKYTEVLLGMNKEDLYMKPVKSLYPEEEWKAIRAQNVRQKGMKHHLETRMIRKNGELLDVDLSLSILKGPDGKVNGSIGIITDITGRKNIEEEKDRVETQLQLAGRLAVVGQLAAGVAHELNNPLAAIQMYSQLLTAREDIDDSVRQDIATIYGQAERAIKITSNLLSFARRHEPEKSLVSVNEIIERSLELHAYRMKINNIKLFKDLDASLPVILADYHQIEQVCANIITNAEHAMTNDRSRGELHIRTERANSFVRITFSDTGPGIPEEIQEKIFDPFFTTKDVGKGTGLGLSICYGIVERHGGSISAKRSTGKGATFTVDLPLYHEFNPADDQSDSIED